MSNLKGFGPPSEFETLRVSQTLKAISSYKDREGYDPRFLGEGNELLLPGAKNWENDLVRLKPEAEVPGHSPFELKYTHFSVVMSASRALPLLSACNIDGSLSKRAERTDVWIRDSRIENKYQNLSEGYGNENKGLFARGHMTRREDPNWGDDETVKVADADTFHVTNVVPQRQGFNGGLWLALENYVLDHTEDNDLKVSVITGPILTKDDPTYYNKQIPTEFWKIIAFVNRDSKELTTIGYKRSQLTFLPKLQRSTFVFGDFDDTQVSIASLQEETGLDFSKWAEYDVMAGAGASLAVKLTVPEDLYLSR